MTLWWSQQDSNLRPLACESKFYSDYRLNLRKQPKHFKRQSLTCLVVLGLRRLQYKHKTSTEMARNHPRGRLTINPDPTLISPRNYR